jgi:hypothetical protein
VECGTARASCVRLLCRRPSNKMDAWSEDADNRLSLANDVDAKPKTRPSSHLEEVLHPWILLPLRHAPLSLWCMRVRVWTWSARQRRRCYLWMKTVEARDTN